MKQLAVLMLGCLACANLALARDPLANPQKRLLESVAFEQRLNEVAPLDLEFHDESAATVRLSDFFGKRPVILVLAYYRCPMLCNQVLRGTATSLNGIGFRAGQDFEVVVVSFDPADTPDLAAAKKQAVLEHYGRPEEAAGWHFLTTARDSAETLAHAVGFQYQLDPASGQFAHASGILVLTPGGRIASYHYGIDYPTRDLRLALVEASEHRIGSPVDEILLYCFHYDPRTGRYGLAIMALIQTAGVATVLALGGWITWSLHRERGRAERGSP